MSEAARACLGSEAAVLRQRLDFPSRIRGSLARHPTSWLVGSLASGLAASLVFRRKPAVVRKSRGLAATLLGLGLTAARPLLKVWLANQAGRWLTQPFPTAKPLRSPSPPSSGSHPL